MIGAVKAAVLLVFLYLDPSFDPVTWGKWILAFADQGRYHIALGLLGLDLACLASVILAPFLGRAMLRLPAVFLIWVLTWFGFLYVTVTGDELDYFALAVLVPNVADTGNALGAFAGTMLWTMAVFIPVLIVFAWPPGRWTFRWSSAFALTSLGAVAAITVLFQATGGLGGYPGSFKALADAGVYLLAKPYSGPRAALRYTGTIKPGIRQIVFIMDESVRGDYLGVNGGDLATTPYLSTHADSLINFGIASSITNCSRDTRLAIRAGLRRDQIPDHEYAALKQPSIWQFAKQAGYETVYIDGHRGTGKYHSFMNEHEVRQIDRLYSIGDRETAYIDLDIASLIRHELQPGRPVFIFADKRGTHFPYRAQYPESQAVFDTAAGSGPEALRNEYRNALRWRVDEFFSKLLAGLDLTETLILYTSDHGQNLMEDGKQGRQCRRTATTVSEAAVPLMVFTHNGTYESALRDAAESLKDGVDQFRVFPSLVEAMGYERAWVRREKGALLLDQNRRPRRFYVGLLFGSPKPGHWVDYDR